MRSTAVISRMVLLVTVVLLATLPASAARRKSHPPKPPEPVYDPSQEVVVRGAVEEVKEPTGRVTPLSALHVVVRSETGLVLVQLAPSSYLKSQDFRCIKGDMVEVIGAQAATAGKQLVLARQVRAGEKTVVLREANGRPVWLKTPQETHRSGSPGG